MRPSKIVFVLVFAVSLAFSACSTQDTPAGSGGSMANAGSVGLDCKNIFFSGEMCEVCMQEQCCAEFAACGETDSCLSCLFLDDRASRCTPIRATLDALDQCTEAKCAIECPHSSLDIPVGECMTREVEPDAGVGFADCKERSTSILRGTIDGKPFDKTFTSSDVGFSEITMPASWVLGLPNTGQGGGYLELFWLGHFNTGKPLYVIGHLRLPGESTIREVKPGSMLWFNCEDGNFRFSVLAGEDRLTGCTW